MANKLYFLLILAIGSVLCMTNDCEATKNPKAANKVEELHGCADNDLKCSGNSANKKAIKATQSFLAVANITTKYFKGLSQIATGAKTSWAKKVTRASNLAEDCIVFGGDVVEILRDCNKELWNKSEAWDKTNKFNETTERIKDDVISSLGLAMDYVDSCANGFIIFGFVLPDILSASMEATKSFMSQVLAIAKNLTTS